ncbi:MAG: PilZ domain-containing protein [Syntrophobacteraceae bacterium]
MSPSERRSFSRVPFSSKAILLSSEGRVSGDIVNLGINGALIKVSNKIEVGREVELEMFLTGAASDVSFILNGVVVRHVADGVAIRFTGMYLDVFERLKAIVGEGFGSRGKIVEEFIRYMGTNQDHSRRI